MYLIRFVDKFNWILPLSFAFLLIDSLRVHMNTRDIETSDVEDNDLYGLLGVNKNATTAEIKFAFKKFALKYHPDKTNNNNESAERFQKISRAYHILVDPTKRRVYNEYGYQGIKLMESCGCQNEKAFKIISKKWFVGLMGVLACLTCCCFGCFCCFFCCNFCCGKFAPKDGYNSDDEDAPLCIQQ